MRNTQKDMFIPYLVAHKLKLNNNYLKKIFTVYNVLYLIKTLLYNIFSKLKNKVNYVINIIKTYCIITKNIIFININFAKLFILIPIEQFFF